MAKPTMQQILSRPAVEAAPLLLGWVICRDTPKGTIKLRLVEVEAYHQDDPASHSHRGLTKRTAPMFEAGGRLYVYFTYGMHYAINIVTGRAGVGEAVLLRAAEPLKGIEIIYRNRFGESAEGTHLSAEQGSQEERASRRKPTVSKRQTPADAAMHQKSSAELAALPTSRTKTLGDLCSGPGKLAQALGITNTKLSGQKLSRSSIYLEPPTGEVKASDIITSPRVGITKAVDIPWRFYIKDNPFISKAVYNKSK